MVESAFTNVTQRRHRKSRRLEKNYDVIALPDRMAKGRYPKGQGFNKRTRIKGRKPVMGDRLSHSEDTIWLRVKRS